LPALSARLTKASGLAQLQNVVARFQGASGNVVEITRKKRAA